MGQSWSEIDPAWAWSPYEPSPAEPWNRSRAAHLYRRAAFGATASELTEAVARPAQEVVASLVSGPASTADFDREMELLSRTLAAGGDPHQLSAWWLWRMRYTPDPLLEKLTLFWHGHFATSAAKVNKAALMLVQHDLLRREARGSFAKMTHGISRDPAMLLYLDSATNRKLHPNENFAREVMELFCLGLGNYTEHDIQDLARCFTGWEVRDSEFKFNPYQHDGGEKAFLNRRGNFSGEQGVQVVLDQEATARFIVGKWFRYFLADEPAAPAALLKPLVDQFRAGGLEIRPVIQRMLGSKLFFSQHVAGRKIRSPVELGVGLLRTLEGQANLHQLARSLEELGQAVFYPPNVKGWDGGRTWLSTATLIGRANLVKRIAEGNDNRFAGGTLDALATKHHLESPEECVDWLLEHLVAVAPPAEVRARLVETARRAGRPQRLGDVLSVLATVPEFQLG